MKGILVFAASWALCGAVAGQTDQLCTAGNDEWNNGGQAYILQDGVVVLDFQTVSRVESALKTKHDTVKNSIGNVRMMASNQDGHEYDEFGVWTGTIYPSIGMNVLDGASDGKQFNYAVDYPGFLVRTDLNWADPVVLAEIDGSAIGVTVDLSDGTIWTHGFDGVLRQYDVAGQLLSAFDTGQPSLGSLAYEASSNSFWLGGASSTLVNVSKTGQFIQSISPPGYLGCAGMEFDVPAPGAVSLLGIAGLAAGRRKR